MAATLRVQLNLGDVEEIAEVIRRSVEILQAHGWDVQFPQRPADAHVTINAVRFERSGFRDPAGARVFPAHIGVSLRPQGGYLVLLADDDDPAETIASTRTEAALTVANYAEKVIGRRNDAVEHGWERSSEALISAVTRLLSMNAELEKQLAAAWGDIGTARARIQSLEAQLRALESERNNTAERWRSPQVIATLATAIFTLVGPMVPHLLENAGAREAANETVSMAVRVEADCRAAVSATQTISPTGITSGERVGTPSMRSSSPTP